MQPVTDCESPMLIDVSEALMRPRSSTFRTDTDEMLRSGPFSSKSKRSQFSVSCRILEQHVCCGGGGHVPELLEAVLLWLSAMYVQTVEPASPQKGAFQHAEVDKKAASLSLQRQRLQSNWPHLLLPKTFQRGI
jgi:hypothetical protein